MMHSFQENEKTNSAQSRTFAKTYEYLQTLNNICFHLEIMIFLASVLTVLKGPFPKFF